MAKSEVRTEKYQLPGTVDGICALVREILNGGHVKRLELDNDDTFVRAHRWVEGDGLAEDEITWDGALRNVDLMVEYYSDGATSFQVIVDMMLLAQEEGLHASAWVIGAEGGERLLKEWLEVEKRKLEVKEINHLLGLPIHKVKSLPPETLILCCSKYPSADPSEITMAVKTSIDLRRHHDDVNEDAGRGGNHPQEHAPAAYPLALATRDLRRVPWRPPSPPGHK